MAVLWTISGSCCDILCTLSLSLVTEPWNCTRADPTWSSVDLLDRSDSKNLIRGSAEHTLGGVWVLVLHQKAKNILLAAHVSGVSTVPVAATYALYSGLDFTRTLNVVPKYRYMVDAPDTRACGPTALPSGSRCLQSNNLLLL